VGHISSIICDAQSKGRLQSLLLVNVFASELKPKTLRGLEELSRQIISESPASAMQTRFHGRDRNA
jgi:hypothetical protein